MRYSLALLAAMALVGPLAADPDTDARVRVSLALAHAHGDTVPHGGTPLETKRVQVAGTSENAPGTAKNGDPIPNCECGCMTTGNCRCKNCAERTADPSYRPAAKKPASKYTADDPWVVNGSYYRKRASDGVWEYCVECNNGTAPASCNCPTCPKDGACTVSGQCGNASCSAPLAITFAPQVYGTPYTPGCPTGTCGVAAYAAPVASVCPTGACGLSYGAPAYGGCTTGSCGLSYGAPVFGGYSGGCASGSCGSAGVFSGGCSSGSCGGASYSAPASFGGGFRSSGRGGFFGGRRSGGCASGNCGG